jgi:hypothetical protein
MYYVYQYSHPETNMPLYIGKGKGDRLNDHWELICNNKRTTNSHWTAKLNQMKSQGLCPIISKIKENLTSDEALLYEEQLILKYGRRDYEENGILYNHLIRATDWTGARHSTESKIKIGLAHKNKRLADWHIAAIVKANTGKKASKETKEKMSKSQTGKQISNDTRKKMSNTARNTPRSEAQQAVFKQALEKSHSKEARTKQAKSMLGKKHSIVTISKMKNAASKRWEKISKPCTVDGITIYRCLKDLLAALGQGKNGYKSPHFRFL